MKNKWIVDWCYFETLSEAETAARRSALRNGESYLYTATSKFTAPAMKDVTSEAVA